MVMPAATAQIVGTIPVVVTGGVLMKFTDAMLAKGKASGGEKRLGTYKGFDTLSEARAFAKERKASGYTVKVGRKKKGYYVLYA
jgi:hypothetical protein